MHVLFTTIQSFESEFYGRVGAELARRGHDVTHLTVSRRSTELLRSRGFASYCLADEAAARGADAPLDAEVPRIESRYGLPTIRDVFRTDAPSERRPEEWAVRRTVRHFQVIERLFDTLRPDVLVPEVGTELIRTVAHLVALDRGVPTLFLFYTVFPKPLRLYVDTMHAPIVSPEEVRPLEDAERAEMERFVREFTARAAPIRPHRQVSLTVPRVRQGLEYVRDRIGPDSDNEYLRPGKWALEHARGWLRVAGAQLLYDRGSDERPFVYFPLHVTDDYKIKRVIPHCYDQASIVEQVADALPLGYDLVVKEHPLSIGRNRLGLLRRLGRTRNIRLLPPRTSSHELIERAAGVAVISSTVGLEALMYAKPVLTIGRPFYAGFGITLDVDSFADLRETVPALLAFSPDRERILRFLHAAMRSCHPGAPVLVDRSDENALALASTLDEVGTRLAAERSRSRAPGTALAPAPAR
jgi:hypothetical protein